MKVLSLFCLLIVVSITNAQNLVPNPSFEEYNDCPGSGEGYIHLATNWSSYGVSPDFFHRCNDMSWGIPANIYGFQDDFTGDGYAGFIVYDKNTPTTDKEFIGVELNENLTIGQKYFISFNVSLPKKGFEEINNNDCITYASNNIGALLSTNPFNEFNPPPQNNFAHIFSESIISDTINWTTISGSFIADSSYSYLSLGIFFDNENTDTLSIFSGNCQFFSYYYFDDVCLSTDSLLCSNPLSVSNSEKDQPFVVYPNPFESGFTVKNPLPNLPFDIAVYSSSGKLVFEKADCYGSFQIVEQYTTKPGIYLLKITQNTEVKLMKLIKH